MVPDTSTSPTVDTSTADDNRSAAINGFLGGIVGALLMLVPLSTLLGGAIAGYLEEGRPEDGLKVGAIAGLLMLVPFVLVLSLSLYFLGFGGVSAVFGLMGLVGLLFSALYTVGLSVLGGYLGVYLKNER
ncbi:DUF5518 domain-containing protein [Halorarum halophilum]|uniref:DUF5518 domain-containing protein n=1 Tax=Halorarum halophilum TaxID=2743090 RepID=A0A7D5K8A2_9EURY|nr:DUF5518 domain-containing protein [Halobaculum halophilum]QLG28119.1 DUF5518 domain-containing protein [Halobaculum halophilum]